ncbi:MAG: GGDEF domain-containing protein [Desulfobacterales bacterium]|nr:GGDEF domain-containing protein [Desulfobacterales bacterium]
MQKKTFNSWSKATKDGLFLIVIFLLIFIFAFNFDLFEYIEENFNKNDKYELDEIILSFSFISLFLAIYAFRRWKDLQKALIANQEFDETLETTNLQLKIKTKALEKNIALHSKLSELIHFLQVCNTMDELFHLISNAAQKMFKRSTGRLFITKESGTYLHLVAAWGDKKQMSEFFSPNDCWGLRLGKIYYYDPELDRPKCKHIGDKVDAVFNCIPFTANGEIIGLLNVQMKRSDYENFNQGDQKNVEQVLRIFSEQISLAISNLRLHEKMKYLAIHDPLTGLYNRQYLEETFEKEFNRAKRNKSRLGLMMIDLDHFKAFNDTHGHSAGDLLLQELGQLMKNFFRAEDCCCRFGGEEFVVLLSDISLSDLKEKGETFRQRISEISLTYQGRILKNVTGSIGISVFPGCGESLHLLIEAADKALYIAKAEGRNRVCYAQEIQAE